MMSVRSPRRCALGDAIRDQRVRVGMTQERLADRAGFTTSYVSHIERGERNLSVRTLRSIANGLSVDPVHLVRVAERLANNADAHLLHR
jgi:transcriptional regulator with XRE-family HTH domain